MKIYTIGFTQKPAERFFSLLREVGVNLLVDTRLRPDSQLSGFAKRGDLGYFARELADAAYLHRADMAPDALLLDNYRATGDWTTYTTAYRALMASRGIPLADDRQLFFEHRCCLLCSEHEPMHCHRRLLAELIVEIWPEYEIIHLV